MTDLDDLTAALAPIAMLTPRIEPEDLARPTPCDRWSVGDVLGHLRVDVDNFETMLAGGDPDWGRPPERVGPGDVAAATDGLVASYAAAGGSAPPAGMLTAEFLLHAWDLARALDAQVAVDEELAARALEFMSANLTPQRRGGAFHEEVQIAHDAPALERLVAFSGRDPGWTRP